MATDLKPTVAILSIGDMGAGIARLLVAKGFRIVTDVTGRSQDTISRAQSAGVDLLPLSDIVVQAQTILSIVPPSDAKSTAHSVLSALLSAPQTRDEPLVYVDLNAVSPSSARALDESFAPHSGVVKFVDGAIIGGPPSLPDSGPGEEWPIPQIPTSGPTHLPEVLASALGSYHISQQIGSASGLKMCFASLTKGFTAIAIQAFTTAQRLGVMEHLMCAVETTIPGMKGRVERGITGMPPKAYRWVREMEEIAATHKEDGGFGVWAGRGKGGRGEGGEEPRENDGEGEVKGEGKRERDGERKMNRAVPGEGKGKRKAGGADMFTGAARTFELVAHGTVLGEEKVGRRKRGRTVEDVARAVAEGLEALEVEGSGRGKRMRVEDEEKDDGE
ncbi:putative Phosphogluconate dehydrogenase [Coniochaeta sp. 2T2.1]|nr:putative Phosphogluconate dehydrogenase [Coniochaeta sp. 2T2.1]